MSTLLIRADASVEIGTGHVMRCLALAQAWRESGGAVFFSSVSMPPVLEKRLLTESIVVRHVSGTPGSNDDAAQTAGFAQKTGAIWIVIDGYHFDTSYQQHLWASAQHLLTIDDYGQTDRYVAAVVLNQNIYAHESLYAIREHHTQLLLGTRYALLRREFWQWRGWRRTVQKLPRTVLVTLGGSDEHNVTLKVMRALQRLERPNLQVIVVIGGANPHRPTLEAEAARAPERFKLLVSVENMPTLIASADLVVSAGGSTCWELAFLGAPIVAITLADNQALIARGLQTADVAIDAGWHTQCSEATLAETIATLLDDPDRRTHMSECGQALVDGRGATRVVEALLEYSAVCK